MKKIITLTAMIILCLSVLTACGCDHEWFAATCEAPKTCSLCGETEGEALAHEWQEATCLNPKYCIHCGTVDGEIPTGHTWQEADCFNPQFCTVCHAVGDPALEHEWKYECHAKPTCIHCGTSLDEFPFHTNIAVLENTSGGVRLVCADCGEDQTYNGDELMAQVICGNWTLRLIASDQLYYPSEENNYAMYFPTDTPLQGFNIYVKNGSYLPITLTSPIAASIKALGTPFPCLNAAVNTQTPSQILWVPGDGSYELDPETYGYDFYEAAATGKITTLWHKYGNDYYIYTAD